MVSEGLFLDHSLVWSRGKLFRDGVGWIQRRLIGSDVAEHFPRFAASRLRPASSSLSSTSSGQSHLFLLFVRCAVYCCREMLRLVSSVSKPASTGRLATAICSSASPASGMSRVRLHTHGRADDMRRAGRRKFSSTNARQADITLTVDGKEVTVPQGARPCYRRRLKTLTNGLQALR